MNRVRQVALIVVLVLVTVGGLGIGAFALASGEIVGVLLLAGGPLLLLMAWHSVLKAIDPRRRGLRGLAHHSVDGVPAVLFPYSSWLLAVYRCLPVAVLALCAAAVLLDGGVVLLAGSVVVACVAAWSLWELAPGRFRRGYVALSPSGIHHRSWTFPAFVPWESCRSVSAIQDKRRGPTFTVTVERDPEVRFARTSRLWQQAEYTAAPSLRVYGENLSCDPSFAYHAVRYYLDHPAARAELADETALRRVRAGDLAQTG